MIRSGPVTSLRRMLAALLILLLTSLIVTGPADAHAELRQSSPEAGATVGGAIHAITMQFFDLDTTARQSAKIFDAAGNELEGQLNREDQRLVIALQEPITTPGEYTVSYAVIGLDGDFSEESFSFRWAEGAPDPGGINVDLTTPVGFDTTNFILLIVGAIVAAFLAQRFLSAFKEHRAAQSAAKR